MPPKGGKAKARPNDTTGRERERLQKEHAEELERRQGELTMQQAVQREEKDQGVVDLTGGARGQTRLPGQTGAGPVNDDGFMQTAGEGETLLAAPVTTGGTTATTGGTLPAGTHSYRVTAVNANGESSPSPARAIATTGATSTATVTWGAVSGATAYRVYGRTAGSEGLLGEVAAGTTTFTDTGAAAVGRALPSRPTSSRAPAIKTNATAVTGTGTETGAAVPGGTIGDQRVRKTVDTVNAARVGSPSGPDPVAPLPVAARGAVAVDDGGAVRQVEDQTQVIRVNEDIEDVTIGAGNTYNFEAGRQYRVPKAVADHLEEKGYVWH